MSAVAAQTSSSRQAGAWHRAADWLRSEAESRAHVRRARGTLRARRLRPRTPARTPWRRGGEWLNPCAARFILAGGSLQLAATAVQGPCKGLDGRQGACMQACVYERMVQLLFAARRPVCDQEQAWRCQVQAWVLSQGAR